MIETVYIPQTAEPGFFVRFLALIEAPDHERVLKALRADTRSAAWDEAGWPSWARSVSIFDMLHESRERLMALGLPL